jgi:hypothetical protein
MAVDVSKLTYLDEQFNDAPEPEGGNSLPDGQYLAKVESVELAETHADEPKLMLKQELVVLEGEFEGRSIRRNNMLATPQNLGWFKSDLRKYGIDIDSPKFQLSDFLSNRLGELLDIQIFITAKNTPDKQTGVNRCNIYLNELAGATGEAPVAAGKTAGKSTATDAGNDDPFAAE